ncbi:Lrp/AsnC family transcriptional regulator [Mycolicibacterium sp. CBMA 226]|uniref:Lrp/AsnC family transcriptional regulator n=1 Tax=Mycolicibacterium sp. CBMA 226 TaxID=2606611 RepID=UPI0012DDD886|nr:Lrp/AsnC family transcriptional regulator [Mycolicibacterium sp. CBMA 226]MUL77138.1 Lrp/AsnC family transcriptional regulator [Mycolicibacterium sp. CBMA 226]
MTHTSTDRLRDHEHLQLQPLDRNLLRCLQLAPRGNFRLFAEVLGVSEQTIGRRYRRMRDRGVLRVTSVINVEALGQPTWLVRVACKPAAATNLAMALAGRDDVGWLSLAGGSEVLCELRPKTSAERDDLLLNRLPASPSVVSVRTVMILNRFAGGLNARGWDLGGSFDADQMGTALQLRENIRSADEPSLEEMHTLDSADWALLKQLEVDGRSTVAQLSQASGLAPTTAARRLIWFLKSGIASMDVDIAPNTLARPVLALLWMDAPSARLDASGRALATFPEVTFVAAVSGPHNLVASVACRSHSHLYQFLTAGLSQIHGLTTAEVVAGIAMVKASTTLIDQRPRTQGRANQDRVPR